tara:strand:- start:14180 stop:14605 length:426 start_codon:yes stop_codon:yes gene_type:complete
MAKLGANAGWDGSYCESLTAASTLGVGDSGKIFFLDLAAGFTATLPAASGSAGWNATFVVKTAPSGADYVVSSASSADYVLGSVSAGATDDVADTSDGTDTQVNFIDGNAVAGDWVKLICDGSAWYIVGGLGKVAAGITIS